MSTPLPPLIYSKPGADARFVSLAAAPAVVRQTGDAAYRRRATPLPGVLVGSGYATALGNLPLSTAGTYRTPDVIATASSDLRVTYGNTYTAVAAQPYIDADNPNTITIRAAIEVGNGGTIYPLTFNGRRDAAIDGGGFATSDPLPIEVPAGQVIYHRVYVTGTGWYANRVAFVSGYGGFTSGSDLTSAGSAAIADSSGNYYGPHAVTGTPAPGADRAQVFIAGDSITAGQGDPAGLAGVRVSGGVLTAGGGWVPRALAGKVGFINTSIPSDRTVNYVAAAGHFRRARLLGAASHVICAYGRNDLPITSLAALKANLVTAWKFLGQRGAKVYQTTITPQNSSTDGWTSITGQSIATPTTVEAARVDLNTWLRAGAPVDGSLVPVAVGTAGALVAGTAGHPLSVWSPTSPIIELADVVETARNSGIWKVGNPAAVTDGAMTSGSNVLTSASGPFTAAMAAAGAGYYVNVPGAGAGGASLTSLITGYTSPTQVTIANNASATVAGTAVKIGQSPALDGLHPTAWMAALMAAAVDTALLV